MSQSSDVSTDGSASSNALPAWVSSGVLGLVIGVGGTLLGMQGLHPKAPAVNNTTNAGNPATAAPSMPGMGGMGGGGMGGAAGGKRALTMLVGKLELLSRPDIKLHVDLNAQQAKVIAAKLTEWENSATMTADEAKSNLDAIEALLSTEQKEALTAIGLPGGRGGGAPGGGGLGGGMGGGMMGRSNTDPNENPFTQEANRKRLRDLLARLVQSSNDPVEK